VEIIRLKIQDSAIYFDEIARLHIAEIHHGILSILGTTFLSLLYKSLSNAPQTGVWVAVEENVIVGFIAGSADVGKAYKSILLNKSLQLFIAAGMSLMSKHVLQKVPSIITYFSRSQQREADGQTNHSQKAELLAIAVSEKNQNQGIGKKLINKFETQLQEWNVHGYYRVTTNLAEKGSNAFYQAIGFEKNGVMSHHNLTLQIYKKKIV